MEAIDPIELTGEQVKQKAGESITKKPKFIEIDVKPKNKFHAWLIKRKIKPSTRIFEIRPQRVDSVYRIATKAVRFDKGMFNELDPIGSMMRVMATHGEDIFYIVAVAIQNNDCEPTQAMINMVKREFEMDDLKTVLEVAVSNYNIPAFLSSIALIAGVDALNIQASQE